MLLALPGTLLSVPAPATADSYEPDDTYATASPIVVDTISQQHTIHVEGDEGWVSFAVAAGRAYVIQTAEGSPAESMDTFLYQDRPERAGVDWPSHVNGLTVTGSNDDYGGLYSRIDYTADADKTVYAMVWASAVVPARTRSA